MGGITSGRAQAIMERLLHQIVMTRAKFALLDLTGVEVVDTSTADHLVKMARAVSLLGARVILTGIQPGVAQTMVSLGVDMSGIAMVRNLQEGLKTSMRGLAGGAQAS